MIVSAFALAGALALELAGCWQLTLIFAAGEAPWTFIAAHIAASTLGAGALFGLLPEQYQDDSRSGVVFLWMISMAMPVFGVLGLCLGLLPALWRQQRRSPVRDFIHATVTERLAPCAEPARVPARGGDGSLMGTLLCAPARDSRLRALIATLSLDVRRSLPLLRIGLHDDDDDVRLLSYALISRKEKALETRIAAALRRVDQSPEAERFILQRSLARDHWELAELTQDGSAANFLLERARLHALAATDIRPREADVQFLLGRVLLKARDLDAARAAFLRAAAAGVALDKVALFLAEIAFHRQQFAQIGMLMQMEKRAVPLTLALRLGSYWGVHRER